MSRQRHYRLLADRREGPARTATGTSGERQQSAGGEERKTSPAGHVSSPIDAGVAPGIRRFYHDEINATPSKVARRVSPGSARPAITPRWSVKLRIVVSFEAATAEA